MTQQEKQKIIDTFNNPPDEHEQDSSQDTREHIGSLHGTKCTLHLKLSGVTDTDEISTIINEHAEDMSRPPPKSTGDEPIPEANKPAAKGPKGNVVFVTHGIKKIKKRVNNFGCVACITHKNINMITSERNIQSIGLNVTIVLEYFVLPMQHTNMRLVMQGRNLPARFAIRCFNLKVL